MNDGLSTLSVASLLAGASNVLARAGYRQMSENRDKESFASNGRLFEDPYTVVAIVAFDTWGALTRGWADAQGKLVDLMASYVPERDAKTWDGYLVLMTSGSLPLDMRAEAHQIERDTGRVRKLVATGEDLRTIGDIERTLLPLLPVVTIANAPTVESDVLSMLPTLLSRRGISEEMTHTLVGAFIAQEPLLERLHEYRTKL